MPRRSKSDVELHPPRSRKARAGTREGERPYVLYAQAPRPGRGALRQEARRGGDRNRAGGGRGGSRALDRGSRRSHLPSAVVLEARGISLAEVEAQLGERTRQSGLTEKASRNRG